MGRRREEAQDGPALYPAPPIPAPTPRRARPAPPAARLAGNLSAGSWAVGRGRGWGPGGRVVSPQSSALCSHRREHTQLNVWHPLGLTLQEEGLLSAGNRVLPGLSPPALLSGTRRPGRGVGAGWRLQGWSWRLCCVLGPRAHPPSLLLRSPSSCGPARPAGGRAHPPLPPSLCGPHPSQMGCLLPVRSGAWCWIPVGDPTACPEGPGSP